MPSPSAASEVEQGKENILSLLSGEPEAPTPEETVDSNVDAETPKGDTEATRILKIPVGDREVDLQILSEDVDPESLRIGYLADKDYRQKSMALADERKNAAARLQELDGALSEAKSMIEVDLEALEGDTELRENDPDEYLRRLDDVQTRAKQYQAHKEKIDTARQAELSETTQKEQELLMNALPSWLDEDARAQDIERIGKQLADAGFSQDEMGTLTDHRVFLIARKAALYDEIQSQDLTEKRDRTPTRTLRPGTAKTSADVISQQERDIRAQLGKTGKVKDAASLFKHILTR